MVRWWGLALLAALLSAASAVAAGDRGADRNLNAALAFVRARCPAPYREINRSMWDRGAKLNALYGNCRAGDGRDQHIWFFSGSRFAGRDTRDSSREILGLWRTDRVIAFLYVLYRGRDPNCCPTGGGKVVRFRLNGGRVRALDPIPRGR